MTNLSPKAQVIVDAYENTTDKYKALAAVLRALVLEDGRYNPRRNTSNCRRTGANLMPDDLHKVEKLFYKSINSYKGLIPSTDFNEYDYALYLQYASAGELERDIVSEKTYRKMIAHDNWDDDQEIIDDKIRMRYL